ncbi:ABC transporter permease [Aeromicrobium phragmitis]|uniref:ABC transporter permease n=2 Tax=Aeromicrobium phragmitis TaxID=2478914 RepID=A0A3L8PR62_9ACTN|nr:ABC transporter permease [Aeromicrobium phragmitis]
MELALSLAVVVCALGIAMIFVVVSGVPPAAGAGAFIDGAFGSQLNLAGTLSKMVPLTLVALAWIIAERAGRFHVGFPGQILVGGLFVSVVALKISGPSFVHLPLALLVGAAGGAVYAALAALLWAKRGVNEILSTLLLNLIALQLLAWWVRYPFHDPATPLALTPAFPESVRWPSLLRDTTLHWDVVLIPLAVVAVAYTLNRTVFGFRAKIVGSNLRFAEHAGISPQRVGTAALVLSGALAGIAGTSLVLAGNVPAMSEDFGSAYGFTGIAVALLARNSPIAVVPSALLFAALQQGAGVMEGTVGLSSSLSGLIQGLMIIFVLASTTVLHMWRRRRDSRRDVAANEPEGARAR